MNGAQPPQGQGQPAGQPGQAAPQQQMQQPMQQQQQNQQRKFRLFRPEEMRNLPEKFSQEEKKKWENGLASLYKTMEANPQESQIYRDAYKKIHDFSATLFTKIQSSGIRPMVNPNQPRPASQVPLGQTPQPQNAQQGQPGQAQQSQVPQQQGQQQNVPPKPMQIPSEQMRQHVNTFPYQPPAGFVPGSDAARAMINQMKEKYLKALMGMESSSRNLKGIEAIIRSRELENKALSPQELKEFQTKRENYQRTHADCERFVKQFRKQQADLKNANAASTTGAQQHGQQGAQGQSGQNTPQQQAPASIAVPPRPTMNLQQPASASQTMQTTQSVQAAMQAANQQQMNGARPNAPNTSAPIATSQQSNEQQQTPQNAPQQAQNVAPNAGQQPGMAPQNQNFQPQIKQEGGGQQAPINASVPPHVPQVQQQQQIPQRQIPMGAQTHQNSPHPATPQSATTQQNIMSNGIPKPLTISDGVAHAQRSYSSSQLQANTPLGHGHPATMQRDSITKQPVMPIPKQLPPNAIAPLHPVQMPPSRPTYTGGQSGSGAGLMNQPAMAKPPGYTVEGDAERVLNKRKLDELVRQVTGGGESLNDADGLSPEVEDVSNLTSLHHHVT